MPHLFNKISIIGLGYIGLPTAAVLAKNGIEVIGVDVSDSVVNTINQGKIHIVEPDLDLLVHQVVNSGKLYAVGKPLPADAFIIAVPTPFKDNYVPDISYVEAAAKSIAPVLVKGNLIIIESTSPVGTTEHIASLLMQERPDLSFPSYRAEENVDISIAYCPERVLPGNVLFELENNDRVIGGMTNRCTKHAQSLYKLFVNAECLPSNAKTAEMAKLTENAFRDVNIAFANELSLICDKLGINVWELIALANHHPRVKILQPGPGVGGHCIAIDPWFIVNSAPEQARLIRTAREVNNYKPHFVLEKVRQAVLVYGGDSPIIACLGLAFKADIDDLRESPAVEITQEIIRSGMGSVIVVEPNIEQLPETLLGSQVELTNLDDAIKRAQIVVVLVNHKSFTNISQYDITGKQIVDTIGLFHKPHM